MNNQESRYVFCCISNFSYLNSVSIFLSMCRRIWLQYFCVSISGNLTLIDAIVLFINFGLARFVDTYFAVADCNTTDRK